MNFLICIPTYNEKENVEKIISAVLAQGDDIEILIIDDNSPDGTAEIVENLKKDNPRIHLIRRPGRTLMETPLTALDITIFVDGTKSVREGHDIADRVQDSLIAKGPDIVDAVVHVEPV